MASAFRLRDNVSLTDTEDGGVLLDGRSGHYWQLNSTGYLIVSALVDGDTLDDVAVTVAEKYRISRDQATTDVTSLVRDLTGARLAVGS
jgi:hypothetical protein